MEPVKWECISDHSDQHRRKSRLPSQRGGKQTVIDIQYSAASAFCYPTQESRRISRQVVNTGKTILWRTQTILGERARDSTRCAIEGNEVWNKRFLGPLRLRQGKPSRRWRPLFQNGIVPDIPYLGKDIIKNIKAAYSTLSASFWLSLVSRKLETAPLEHRSLLVQLQDYLNYGRFSFRARRKYATNPTLKDRILQIHKVVATVSPEILEKEDRVWNIYMCRSTAKRRESQEKKRMTEMPVATSCAHGPHLLGVKCLRH
jgi:hypothetical protein